MNKPGENFTRLVKIIADLRDPERGCPWDLKQTHASLKQYLIEESYELLEAIDHAPANIAEELGDVLLQVVLHSQIAADEKRFTIDDVVELISDKLVERHPHVFGDTTVKSASEVEANWEAIKQRTKKEGVLAGVPKSLPALLRAQRIGDRVARVGFDWNDGAGVIEKIEEELGELRAASEHGDKNKMADELGDVLFTVAQLVRKLGHNAEELLSAGCDKFTARFETMEKSAGKPLSELSFEDLHKLWDRAKKAVG